MKKLMKLAIVTLALSFGWAKADRWGDVTNVAYGKTLGDVGGTGEKKDYNSFMRARHWMLKKKVNPYTIYKDKHKNTLLHHAVWNMNKRPAYFLTRWIIDPHKFGNPDSIRFKALIDNQRGFDKKTPLRLAVDAVGQHNPNQAAYIIKLLLVHGADPSKKDKSGVSPYTALRALDRSRRKKILKGFSGYFLTLSANKQKEQLKNLLDSVKDDDLLYQSYLKEIASNIYSVSEMASVSSVKSAKFAENIDAPLQEYRMLTPDKRKRKDDQTRVFASILSTVKDDSPDRIDMVLNRIKPSRGINWRAGNKPLLILATGMKANKVIDQILAMSGVNPAVRGMDGRSALKIAMDAKNYNLMTRLVQAERGRRGFIHDEADRDSAALMAVKTKDKRIISAILAGNPSLDDQDLNGNTALLAAVQVGLSKEVVEELVAKGADLGAKNNDGESAFAIAIDNDNKSMAKYLYDRCVAAKK